MTATSSWSIQFSEHPEDPIAWLPLPGLIFEFSTFSTATHVSKLSVVELVVADTTHLDLGDYASTPVDPGLVHVLFPDSMFLAAPGHPDEQRLVDVSTLLGRLPQISSLTRIYMDKLQRQDPTRRSWLKSPVVNLI